MFIVKICFVVVVMGTILNGATSIIHGLMSLRTCSTYVPQFPDFVLVNLVDGLPAYYYDSVIKKAVPRVEWVNRLAEEIPQFWEKGTQMDHGDELQLKELIENVRQSLNQTEGLHILQWMVGCEWNDETDEVSGYSRYAFDGEDFISMDWDTQTWVTAKPQAIALKLRWEDIGEGVRHRNQLIHYCVERLKKLVGFGEKTLQRKELPEVWFLQKSSSSPVTCLATGFYPDRALLFWAKDGEELEEDVGEILPNHDGTFQSSVSLDLSSVPREDWCRYSCVFQLSSVPDDLVTVLDPNKIRTNEKKLLPIIVSVLVALAVAAVFIVAGVVLYRKCRKNNVL